MVKQHKALRKGAAVAVCAVTLSWSAPALAQIAQVDIGSLSATQSVSFGGLAGGPVGVGASTNYDGLLVIDGVSFGERFGGQSVNAAGVFDQIGGLPNGSLSLVTGDPGRNLSILNSPAGAVLVGLGPLGYPANDALGEGAVSILFPTGQSEFGFRLAGGNGGNAFLSFFRADGSLIGTSTLGNLPLGVSNYGFVRSGGIADIYGVSIWNNDVTGFGLANIRFNVATGVPEPSTWAMMLMGFGAIGSAMRRRRRSGSHSAGTPATQLARATLVAASPLIVWTSGGMTME